MALLKIVKGSYEEISQLPVVDGTLLFATDEHRFFLDHLNERIEFTSEADGGNSSNVVMVQSSQPTDANCKIWIQI